ALDFGRVEALQRLPTLVDPFAYADRPHAPHERLALLPLEVVQVAAVDPLNGRDVLETRGRQVDDARPATLEDRIYRDRPAHDDTPDPAAGGPESGDRRRHRLGGRMRSRRHLRERELARLGVVGDEIGERPAGVNADQHHASTYR